MALAPFFREAGSGPGVVCVHSNASNSGQWRGLMDLLAPRFHALAADSYGAGKSPPWPRDRKLALRDEVALLEPVFARAGDRFSLVGHSYGGGIALVGALVHRQRLRAMALYEPTLFALVERESPSPNDVDGIRSAVTASVAALDAGTHIIHPSGALSREIRRVSLIVSRTTWVRVARTPGRTWTWSRMIWPSAWGCAARSLTR
jgi:pimeloyl-ACP methyl ester carboxylesterase